MEAEAGEEVGEAVEARELDVDVAGLGDAAEEAGDGGVGDGNSDIERDGGDELLEADGVDVELGKKRYEIRKRNRKEARGKSLRQSGTLRTSRH